MAFFLLAFKKSSSWIFFLAHSLAVFGFSTSVLILGLCVVEDLRDVLAIEATAQFHGLYHVLGGRISPMDGIAPSDLNIESLLNRIQLREFDEVILALSPTMEGDTTAYFLYRKLAEYSLRITTLARGVGFGDELEFADEVTLGRSILQRQPFEQTLRN